MRNKPFSMKDLANEFGVSTSTISRALNPLQQHLISPDLVVEIKEKAKEVGYTINPQASALKSSKTKKYQKLFSAYNLDYKTRDKL